MGVDVSRYLGNKDSTPILAAADHWKRAALVSGGSVFSGEPLWTIENLDALRRDFVAKPDLGQGTFQGNLKNQLAQSPAPAKKLAAEMMWLLYLCPSSLTIEHKRQVVGTVWSWANDTLPQTQWLSEAVLGGIGSAGPGFNQNQWRELAFLITFARAFRELAEGQRASVLADPWSFDEWLKIVPDWESRQFRHMLLFLLFPDDFERIFAQRDRKSVALSFGNLDAAAINSLDPVALDRVLWETRRELEAKHGTTNLDYYLAPLVDQWKQGAFNDVARAMKTRATFGCGVGMGVRSGDRRQRSLSKNVTAGLLPGGHIGDVRCAIRPEHAELSLIFRAIHCCETPQRGET